MNMKPGLKIVAALTLTTLLLTIPSFDLVAKSPSEAWQVEQKYDDSYQIDINVTEGTWMNLTISPDGKTLAFDLLGDIYTLPIDGGEAKQLTHSIAWEMQPQFSPDGQFLAYTSDAGGGDNIWLMGTDGSNPTQLTDESFRLLNSPAWSPDSRYITARKHFTGRRSLGAGEIWIYHKTGGKGFQLKARPNEQKDLGEPSFSPDGKKVYFSHDSTPGEFFEYNKNSNQVIYEIFSIDRETGKTRKEVSGAGGSVRPTPSPDGRFLAFVRRIRNQTSLFIKELETGKTYPIYKNLDRDMQETWAIHGVYPTIAWTPDSHNLVFWSGGKIRKLNRITQVAKTIPFHIETQKTLRKAARLSVDPAPEKFKTHILRWVKVRPDGNQVVFQALGKLYIRDLPDGRARRLTRSDDMEFYPEYSKDGRYLTFTTWNDFNQGSVKIVSSRGGRATTLTSAPGKYIEPSFSNDGKYLVFKRINGNQLLSPDYNVNPGIYSISINNRKTSFISEEGSHPFFSLDDKRIYLTQSQGNNTLLFSLNLEGKDKIEHAKADFVSEFLLSPDENNIAFKKRYQIFVAPYTTLGKPALLNETDSSVKIIKVSSNGGNYLSWSNKGQQLNWALGSHLHSQIINDSFWEQEAMKTPDSDQPASTVSIDLGFEVESDRPKGSILLSGAQIITMKGDQVLAKGDILISDNLIEAVGESGSLKVADNTVRLNLKGKTIIPGLIDVHWHGSQSSAQITPQQNWQNLASLTFGVTTIHDPSNNTASIFSAAEMEKAGKILAPRIFSTGTILYGATSESTAQINSLDEAEHHLKRLKSQGAFSVKSYNQPRREQRQQILQAARKNQMLVMPEGGSTFQHNLTMIVDGHTGIEHAIPTAAIYQDIFQLWSQSETAYTPTLVVAYGGIWGENYWYQKNEVWKHPLLSRFVPKDILYQRAIRRPMAPEEDYNHFNTARVATQLLRKGVRVQLGAHGQREGLGAHWEMWMFAQGGMSPMEVIRAATINGAIYLGMDKQLGSLEPGKLADMVILDSNPLENIFESDQVDMVMKNGRLYDSQTLNEIGLHPKKRIKLFFEQD
ncbi:amidohydrolase family protein [Aliikangiella sp. G2MR2-5]|uniref:amidohydrolase family protein n=1 Tax=Aliikangiella sp. G2MR2-5 TaxID=2788943 RepID=UPI001FEF80CC|nr:amidohydrolase family protein [Aliikangiella sp. G2MR2-5]